MFFIPVAIECLKLVIMAIILYYVCEALSIPPVPKLVCQLSIIAIAIFAAIQIGLGSAGAGSATGYNSPRLPSFGPAPSIMVPEKR